MRGLAAGGVEEEAEGRSVAAGLEEKRGARGLGQRATGAIGG